jgi:hypothetical protein
MTKPLRFFLFMLLASSLGCQFPPPTRTGTVISECAPIVSAVASLQSGQVPSSLFETGKKQGDEFDVAQYFNVLTHLSMQEGYAMDYVYQIDSLGGYPLLYARPVDQAPFPSVLEIPEDTPLPDFREHVEIEDVEQGYFEYVVLDIMANQFYLYWHANYNDRVIVCNRQQVYDIVEQVSSGEFGAAMDAAQKAQARTLQDIRPVVRLTGDVAVVEIVTFTKWGGFYRETYTIRRGFPHTIVDVKQENVVPYDCGVMF